MARGSIRGSRLCAPLHMATDNRDETAPKGMQTLRLTEQFKNLMSMAVGLTETVGIDAILLLVEGTADWARAAEYGSRVRSSLGRRRYVPISLKGQGGRPGADPPGNAR